MQILFYILFIASRLINLRSIPVFNDEAIYIDWGYRAININGLAFYSLYDSKQPLLLWLFGISQKFISDPLVASRFVSVIFGFLSLYGITLLAKQLFAKKSFNLAPLIYFITPIFLFFDKQALMESAVFCMGVYLYLFFIKFKNSKNLLYSALFGLIIGISFYIKSSVVMYVFALIPLFIIEVRKNTEEENLKLYIKLFVVVAVASIILIPLLSQDLFWKTVATNDRFILSFPELFSLPIAVWTKNIFSFFAISTIYISPFLLPILLFVFFKTKSLNKNLRDFFVYFIGVVILAIFFTRNLNVRYTMPLLFGFPIFFEYVIQEYRFKKKVLNYFYVLLFVPSVMLSFLLLLDNEVYFKVLNKFPKYSQYEEYLVAWTSGAAVQKAVSYINEHQLVDDGEIFIGVRTDAGNPENTVIYSFYENKNVIVSYFDDQVIKNLTQYDCLKSAKKFIFVSRDNNFGGTQEFWQEKIRFYNLEEKSFVAVHTTKDECEGRMLEIN